MQDDVIGEKRSVKPEHLEVLFRIVKERVVRKCELSELEIKGLEYWSGLGLVDKNEQGIHPIDPIEREVHYSITDKGEDYCLDYQHSFDGSS